MKESNKNNGLLRGTAIVGILTLLSRILGFVRDLLFAKLFGAGLIADAFFVAFRIPNLLRSIMAEGALTSGFVPVFTSELKSGATAARSAIAQVTGFLLISTMVLATLGIFFSSEIVTIFAPGFVQIPEKFALTVNLLRIMFPYIVFVSLVAMIGGALNSIKIFGTAAMAQVAMNIVFIIGIVVAMRRESEAIYIVSWSVLIGGVVQVIYQLPALKKAGLLVWPSFNIFSPIVRQVVKLMVPAIFGAAIYQVGIFFNTIFASFLTEGSVAWLFYADRIAQLPIGIYSIALASVLLPALAHASANKDGKEFADNLFNSLRYTIFIMIPFSMAIFIFAEPIIRVVFERGEFTDLDALNTASALKGYALGLWSISMHTMIIRGFIARKDTVTPTLIGAAILFLNILFSLILVGEITPQEGGVIGRTIMMTQNTLGAFLPLYSFGHVGLAIASSISSFFGFMMAGIILTKDVGALFWKRLAILTLKTTIIGALALLPGIFIYNFQLSPLLTLLIGVVICPLLFIFFAKILKIQEIEETFKIFKRIDK